MRRARRETRSSLRGLAALALASLVSGSAFGPAAAETAGGRGPFGEGRFAVNFTGFGTTQARPVVIGKGRVTGVTDTVLTAINATGDGFLHQLPGRCIGWYIADTTRQTFESQAHCNYTDSDGDVIYERADFEEQPAAPVRIGTGRWLGGTGKYERLSGVFEIRTISIHSARPDVIQYIGSKDGTYRLPRP